MIGYGVPDYCGLFNYHVTNTMDAFRSTKNFENFETRTNGSEMSGKKLQKIPEIVEFSISELFKQNLRKVWDDNQMERKFPGKKCSKMWVYFTRLCSFSEIVRICKFLLSASSFGHCPSDLVSHARMTARSIRKLKWINILL